MIRSTIITTCIVGVLLTTASAASGKVSAKRRLEKQNALLSLIEGGVHSMQCPLQGFAKKEAQSTGRYISYIEVSTQWDGEWGDDGVLQFTYDAQGRIATMTPVSDEEDYFERISYAYAADGKSVVETDSSVYSYSGPSGISLSRATYYFGDGNMYASWLNHQFHLDMFNMDQPEFRKVDSVLMQDLEWDEVAQEWIVDNSEKLVVQYGIEFFTVTDIEMSDDGEYVSSVEKFFPAFTADGRVDSISSIESDGGTGEFYPSGVIRHSYDGAGRLSAVEIVDIYDVGMTMQKIQLTYNSKGFPGEYMMQFIDEETGAVENYASRLVFHYVDEPNAPVKKPVAGVNAAPVTARVCGSMVMISSSTDERIMNVAMYDLSGRETARFNAAASNFSGVRQCAVPLPARPGTLLLRIRTDRSVETVKLQGAVSR